MPTDPEFKWSPEDFISRQPEHEQAYLYDWYERQPEQATAWFQGLDASRGILGTRDDKANPLGWKLHNLNQTGGRVAMVTNAGERDQYVKDVYEGMRQVPLFKEIETTTLPDDFYPSLADQNLKPRIAEYTPLKELVEQGGGEVINPDKPRRNILSRFGQGLREGYLYSARGASNPLEFYLGPLAAIPTPGNWGGFSGEDGRQLKKYLRQEDAGKTGLIGAHIGNALGQIGDYWPMRFRWRADLYDLFGTYGPGAAAKATGLAEADYGEKVRHDPVVEMGGKSYGRWRPGMEIEMGPKAILHRSRGIPIALAGAVAANIASGNIDPTKLFDTEEGPRSKGYRASDSDYDSPTKTQLYPFALAGALTGTNARPLPWADFQKERPDITKEEYDDYMHYYYGDTDESEQPGDFSLLGDMIKFTPTNLEGVPEIRALGSRMTLPGIAAGAGAMLGTAYLMKKALTPKPMESRVAVTPSPDERFDVIKLGNKQPRRVA